MEKFYNFLGAIGSAVFSVVYIAGFVYLWQMPVEGSNTNFAAIRFIMALLVIAACVYVAFFVKNYRRLQEPW